MSKYLVFSIVCGFSFSVQGVPYEFLQYGSLSDGPGYEELKTIIRSENIADPDELLNSFSQKREFQKFLDYFSLVYESGSRQRQDVSFEYPRIISHFGRVVLGMTGKPLSRGGRHYQRIEVIEFLPKTSQFAFHEIDFRNSGEDRFVDSPSSCRDCHGTNSRPIWATYPLWPGVYGGNDDILSNDGEPIEATGWSNFYSGNRKTGRYSRFRFGADFNFDRENPRVALDGFTRFIPSMPLPTRENLRLSAHLSAMNERRVFADLTQADLWKNYKFALIAATLDCDDITKFLPDKVREQHQETIGKSPDEANREMLQKVRSNSARKRSLFMTLSGSKTGGRPSLDLASLTQSRSEFLKETEHFSVLTKLRYLIEGQAVVSNLSPGNWGLDFDPQDTSLSYTIDHTYQNLESLPMEMYRKVQSDPDVKDLGEDILMMSVRQEAACATLKERSLQTFGWSE